MLRNDEPFSFSRFSDGETEVLKNRKLTITKDSVFFRNKALKYSYPVFDTKSFLPERDAALRADLLRSLLFEDDAYFKGVPGSHNSVQDQQYYLELLDNNLDHVTLADIFMNTNYSKFIRKIMKIIKTKSNVVALCNESADPDKFFTNWLTIPTDAFPQYEQVYKRCMKQLCELPDQSIVLSSASSLSNIFAHNLRLLRPDCTFLDLGSALNSYLGLDNVTRVYHVGVHGPKSFRDLKMYIRHLVKRQNGMKW